MYRGSSKIRPFRNVTLFQYKIAWKGIPESHEDDNKLSFQTLSDKAKSVYCILAGHLNRGKTIEEHSSGSHKVAAAVYLQHYTGNSFGTLTTGCLMGVAA